MTDAAAETLGLTWWITFRFADRTWIAAPGATDPLIDFIAATPWWSGLDMLGAEIERGAPRGSIDDVKRRVATGKRALFTFGRGGPDDVVGLDRTDLSVWLEILPTAVEVRPRARAGALRALGAAALDGVIAPLFELRDRWRDRAALITAYAEPFADVELEYPRVRPPRYVHQRSVRAIADVVDPLFTAGAGDEHRLAAARAMAAAPVPADVKRVEHAGAVAMRWCDDPSDLRAVCTAAAHHERWLAGVIETELEAGWNDAGDREVVVRGAARAPFAIYDDRARIGYLAATGDLSQARRDRTDDGAPVQEVRVIAPDRAAALAIASRARSAGATRVVYGAPPVFWDPAPDGPFLTPEG